LAAKNSVYNQVNEGGLANESLFAIILQTFKELTNPNTLINSSTTLTDWTRMSSPTSPYLFKEATPENINIIKNLLKENPYAMFLRKVDRAFPDAALKEIMDIDFGHVYPVLHNQAKSNVKLITDIIEKKEHDTCIAQDSLIIQQQNNSQFIALIVVLFVLVFSFLF
jgi:hypothetical protein